VILIGVDGREDTVAGSAATAIGMTIGRSLQGAVSRMARCAGGMDFRISRVNRVADGCVTAGTRGGHRYPEEVCNIFVVIDKASMTGGAITPAVTTTNGGSILTGSDAKQTAISAMA